MFEHTVQMIAKTVNQFVDLIVNDLVPQIGVGGSIQSMEKVPFDVVYMSIIVLALIGMAFGVSLAFIASKFKVQMDPRVEQVREVLPGANCGACGFAGCMGYAEAVVGNPDVATHLCAPGKSDVAEQVAALTGKAMEKVDPKIARVFCQGSVSKSRRKFIYSGALDCTAAVLVAGGDKACQFGCLGYGTCMRACPFDAITMSDDELPIIDREKCTACGKCVSACPKNVIELATASKTVVISCHSTEKGVAVKKKCQVGCIGCGLCVRTCPVDAIALENNLARIDHEKCIVCGLCVRKCPTSAIRDYIPVRPKAFINPEKCMGIDVCSKVCPVNAISGDVRSIHVVDQEKCIGCGMCESRCPKQAIEMRQPVTAKVTRKVREEREELVGA